MTQNAQDRCNLAAMGGEADVRRWVGGKYFIEQLLRAHVLGRWCFGSHASPELVVLGKPGFDSVPGEGIVDVRLVTAPVAGMLGDAFAQILLDDGNERMFRRQRKAREGQIGRDETSRKRRGVVAFGRWGFLLLNARPPERVCCQGLSNPFLGELCIGPDSRSVATQKRPVAVPRRRAIEGLGRIVPSLSVATQEKKLVLYILGSLCVQGLQEQRKPLPLGQRSAACWVGWISLVDQTEIGCRLAVM